MSKYAKNMSHLMTMDLQNTYVESIAADWYEMFDAVWELVHLNDREYEIADDVLAVVAAFLVRNHA